MVQVPLAWARVITQTVADPALMVTVPAGTSLGVSFLAGAGCSLTWIDSCSACSWPNVAVGADKVRAVVVGDGGAAKTTITASAAEEGL